MGTINSTVLHRELFGLDIEKCVENMYVWRRGSSFPGRGAQHAQRQGRKQRIEGEREFRVVEM